MIINVRFKNIEMKCFTIGLLFLVFNLSCQSNDGPTENEPEEIPVEVGVSQISYTSTSEVFTNPERGFMHTWTVYSEGEAVNMASLNNLKNSNISLVLRLYYLEKFKDSPLSETQLNLIRTDFERFREAGIKCVLRFAYNSDQNETDAPLNIIETHLDQLKPLFTENADIIAFVQAGFIGSWGEWYYTTNELTTPENKKVVLDKLLEVFPEEIKIQVRTPLYKQEIFEYSTAMDASVGYGNSAIARVGFHNDCFLASSTDYGTYQNIELEKKYISDEALFVPTGGETCPPTDVPLASCSTAETEMKLLKWTYLNLDYYGPVLQQWRDSNCFDDFERELGYRLALDTSELKDEATTSFNLKTTIENLGFAPVYNPKNSYLIFRSKGDGAVYKKKLDFDVRLVVPSVSYELEESVSLSDIPAGEYELLLEISDSHISLEERPEYKIRLANDGLWESSTGFNKLSHTLTIK